MKILVVDDERKTRDSIKKRLSQNLQWDVSLAASQTEAIEKIDAVSFDLVATDMEMETDGSGIAVLNAAKKKNHATAVIIIASRPSFDGANEAMEKGAYGYIDKQDPAVYEKLYEKVEKIFAAAPVKPSGPPQAGMSDFERTINEGHYYIDKSLLIKEVFESGLIILITRPRRFGKTLNMDMLRCFFEKKETSRKPLFENLKIGRFREYMKIQGEFPVACLSFKDVGDEKNWEACFFKTIKACIRKEYRRHESAFQSLDDYDQKTIRAILDDAGDQNDFEFSLARLIEYLNRVYGKRVIVLIDEYDVSIQTVQKNGYYDTAVSFFRNMLTRALKDNRHIEKGVLTGVLRIAKEGIFSGLNNLKVFSI